MVGMWLPRLPCAIHFLTVLPWLHPKPHLVSAPTRITQMMCCEAHAECHHPVQVKPLKSIRSSHISSSHNQREKHAQDMVRDGERMLGDGWVRTRSPNVSTGLPPPTD